MLGAVGGNELGSRQLGRYHCAAGLGGLVVGRAVLLGEVVTGVLDGTLRRGRTLVAPAHIGSDEVAPRTARVAVGQRDVVVAARRGGVVQGGDVTAVERCLNQVRHTLCGEFRCRGAVGGVAAPHVLESVLRHHRRGVGQLDEVVEELQHPGDVLHPRNQVVEVEVTLGASELDGTVLQ